jgi:hypothetical protein
MGSDLAIFALQALGEAIEWLNTEHAEWSTLLESGPAQARPFMVKTLEHWHPDPDLAGIRDEKDLARLPEGERSAVKQLWSDVDALLRKARRGK